MFILYLTEICDILEVCINTSCILIRAWFASTLLQNLNYGVNIFDNNEIYSPKASREQLLLLLVALVVLVSELVEMLELTKSGSSASNVIPSSNSVKASESVDIILEQNRQGVCKYARL